MALIIDNFAGGGGASTGIAQALGRAPDFAINHDPLALEMHAANHPETQHLIEDVWNVVPEHLTQGQPVEVAWFSPDCRHFSKAKGGKPVSGKIRGLASVVVKWARTARPQVIFLENVEEFLDWGPVDTKTGKPIKARRGQTFRGWVRALEALGYVLDWRVLDAADYGVPTHRKRLFLVARCDGEPIRFPEPTHGPGRQPYVPASSIIDWSIPGKSIFGRKRPLAEASMFRIANGLRRFILEPKHPDDAFIVRTGHARADGKTGRTFRGQRLNKPIGTVCASGNDKALIVPWLCQYYGGMTGKPVSVPLPAITAIDHNAICGAEIVEAVRDRLPPGVDEVRAFLTKYYGTATGQPVASPAHTLTAKARLGLVEVHGKDYQIVDITLRMLQPHELAAAQGLPEGYVLTGTKAQQIAKIGNSVVPEMARRMVESNVQLAS